MLLEHLVCGKHSSKCFICINWCKLRKMLRHRHYYPHFMDVGTERWNKGDKNLDLALTSRRKARTAAQGLSSEPEWRCRASSWAAHAPWPPSLGSAISLGQCPPPWDFCVCSCQSTTSPSSLLIGFCLCKACSWSWPLMSLPPQGLSACLLLGTVPLGLSPTCPTLYL